MATLPRSKSEVDEKSNISSPIVPLNESLRNNINSIMEDNKYSDVTFVVGNNCENIQKFTGIRALFAAQSDIFKSMLFGHMLESSNKEVIIKDVTPSAFNFIRKTFYFQNPKLSCDITVDVLYAAQMYLIPSLIAKCQTYLLNIEKPKVWYKIMIQFAKYPKSTFYPFFETFTQSVKALNIANCIQHDNDSKKNSDYYYDKYLLLNSDLFTSKLKMWQIEQLLKCGVNDQRMFKACMKWSKYQNKNRPLSSLCQDIGSSSFDDHHSNAINTCNDWTQYMQRFVKYFDFNKFSVDFICDEVNSMSFVSKDNIIEIMRRKFKTANEMTMHLKKQETVQNQDEKDGFHMNEMLLTESDLSLLRVGDKIDHRDYKGRWCKASITQKQFMFIKLHYVGWNSQYDTWIHISEEYEKLAKYGRITRRQVQRTRLQNLKIGDEVQIRLPSCHRFHYMGWIKAKVSYIEEDTGQIKFSYGINEANDAKYSWWTHPDNVDECKPFDLNENNNAANGNNENISDDINNNPMNDNNNNNNNNHIALAINIEPSRSLSNEMYEEVKADLDNRDMQGMIHNDMHRIIHANDTENEKNDENDELEQSNLNGNNMQNSIDEDDEADQEILTYDAFDEINEANGNDDDSMILCD